MKSNILVKKFFDLKQAQYADSKQNVKDCGLVKKIRTLVGFPAAADKKVSRSDLQLNDSEYVHLDIGGEGCNISHNCISGFETSVNVNDHIHQSVARHNPIPNLIFIDKWFKNPSYPFADHFADYITMQNAPLTDQNVTEIARCLRPGGKVELWINSSFKANIDKLATLLHSKVEDKVADEFNGSTGSPKFRIISGVKPVEVPKPVKP